MNAQTDFKPISTTIIEYDEVAAGLATLHAKYHSVVYDVTSKDGMEQAKAARGELRKVRTSLEEKRKEIKAPALARAKAIDTEAKLIEEAIVALEKPIASQIEAETMRIEEEKRQREEAERDRIAKHTNGISEIKLSPSKVAGQKSESIKVVLESLQARVIEGFEEFQREAEAERTIAIATLTGMLAGAQAQEAEAARIAAEREELARLRKEGEERAAREAEERKARIAAEEKALAEQRAREKAEADAVRERLDREARERREAEDREARERRAAEDAEAKRAFEISEASRPAPAAPSPEEQAHLGREFDRGMGDAPDRISIAIEALKKINDIAMPGSDEQAIAEKALREIGAL